MMQNEQTNALLPSSPYYHGRRWIYPNQSTALKELVESFRDWGRDCWCAPAKDNTCGKCFEWHSALRLGDVLNLITNWARQRSGGTSMLIFTQKKLIFTKI